MWVRESQWLNSSLDRHLPDDIDRRLDDLKWFIDDSLLKKYEERIAGILEKNPWSSDIVRAETDKLGISLQVAMWWYKRDFRSIMDSAVNDNFPDSDTTNSNNSLAA